MQALDKLNAKINYVFCDIDDTISTNGMLEDKAYTALWKLYKKNIKIIPITGRPAGWCEMIARFWPVEAVVGENGGFYFKYDRKLRKMQRSYAQSKQIRRNNQEKLFAIKDQIFAEVPGAAIASDQFCRQIDLAIDFCEDVKPLGAEDIAKIIKIFNRAGAITKISSIHINAWYGEHDKLSQCKIFCEKELNTNLEDILNEAVFIGDSPNDEPLFAAFKHSVGVANVKNFKDQMDHLPKYICSKEAGDGFTEFVNQVLN